LTTPTTQTVNLLTSIPWIIAIGGTVINLLWNFINYKKTTGLQKNIRKETVRLEEFRRVRTPIDSALTELGNEKANFAGISKSATPIAEWREQINASSAKIVLIFIKLQDALTHANSSQYTSKADWLEGIDPVWDQFSSAIDKTQNTARSEIESRSAAGTAASKLTELTSLINGKIDKELNLYTTSPTLGAS
jgi:hypothetical protein